MKAKLRHAVLLQLVSGSCSALGGGTGMWSHLLPELQEGMYFGSCLVAAVVSSLVSDAIGKGHSRASPSLSVIRKYHIQK